MGSIYTVQPLLSEHFDYQNLFASKIFNNNDVKLSSYGHKRINAIIHKNKYQNSQLSEYFGSQAFRIIEVGL